MRLLFYPTFDAASELTDHFYRLHWFLYPFKDQITEVILPVASSQLQVEGLPDLLDSGLVNLVGSIKVKLLENPDAAAFAQLAEQADCVFVWRVGDDGKPAPEATFKAKRIIRVDHAKLRHATSFYLKFPETFAALQASYVDRSRKIFEEIRTICAGRTGYVFGTGPNLSMAAEHDFSDGVSIACNSMVRNYELMERLRPPLIVVADPIFHAGPSNYAEAFRADLIRALDRFGSYLIVPMRDYHIYLAHLPERFSDRIAAIPFVNADKPNLDLTRTYNVTSTGNILTLFLLPLAATFFEEIRVLGCDGRPMAENTYFWSHDKASQFNEKMQDIQKAHPAFFAIDYDDYYLTHSSTLATWLVEAERAGKVVKNLTPSHIPALQERTVSGGASAWKQDNEQLFDLRPLLISIDPEVGKNVGHYTPLNDRTAEAAAALDIEFIVYGNEDQSALGAPRSFLRPCFTVNSWTFRLRDQGERSASYEIFRRELEAVRNDLRRQPSSQPISIFMYCGSFSAAEALLQTFGSEPNVTLSVNLFYCSFFDYAQPEVVLKWRSLLRRFLRNGRNRLFGSTERLAEEMSAVFGVTILPLPCPSTTFGDGAEISASMPRGLDGDVGPVIGFPGAMREEKGFLTAMTAVRCLTASSGPKLHCLIAGRHRHDTPAEMVDALTASTNDLTTVEENFLDDEAFIAFLARADVTVLPYKAHAFKDRPSGILVDMVTIGRPIVAVQGTWLADQILRYGWGEVASDDGASIAAAVLRVLRNYDSYVDAIQRSRDAFLSRHSWRELVLLMMGRQGQAESGASQFGDEAIGGAASALRQLGRKFAMLAHDSYEEVERIYSRTK